MNAFINRCLNYIEEVGNRLPHPTLLFIILCGIVLAISLLASLLGLEAYHPINGSVIKAQNLLSQEGLHKILANTVKNFVQFAPVGTVLVAVMGIGIAEHSGLLGTVIKATILKAPRQFLSFFVVIMGVMSSLAADTGYVVLLPLAGVIFWAAGRHPVIGIAAAFAGVSGGFSANLIIGPLDAILAGISTEAAKLVTDDYFVTAAGNYYFIFVSTFLIGIVGTWVTEKVVAPRFPSIDNLDAEIPPEYEYPEITPEQKRALKAVGLFSLAFIGLILAGLIPEQGFLRDPETHSILRSPMIKGIVTIIAVYGGLCGIIFGHVSGQYKSNSDFIKGMEEHMATMAGYLVLMFFAAQLVNYFAWSNLGAIMAIKGALLLQALAFPPAILLVCFILLAAGINLFIGSASAKWALLAPIFVPMLLLAGISPEATQVAFRIGDSATNIITPLMPYFGVAVAFAQHYKKDIGIGSIIAIMLPYSIAFLLSWACLLFIWVSFDWPLGPGANILFDLPSK